MTLPITRTDLDADGLRSQAILTKNATTSRRMLALALILEGYSRTEISKIYGTDLQILRDWVIRYNEYGLLGLYDKPHVSGPARLLTVSQRAEFADIVRQGPDVNVDGVVRWRRVDLQRVINERFEVKMHERTVGKLLHSLGFSHISARPTHPKAKVEEQEALKKTLQNM